MEFYWPLVLVLDKLLRRKFDNPWVKFLKMESLKFIYYFWAVFLFYYYVFFLMTGMVGAYADSKGRAGGGVRGVGGQYFYFIIMLFLLTGMREAWGGGVERERERGAVFCREISKPGRKKWGHCDKKWWDSDLAVKNQFSIIPKHIVTIN